MNMKAILTDYSHWSSARKLSYMESVPDRFFRIKNSAGSEMCGSCFAVYDVSDLKGISSGDGETIVSIRGRKEPIYCDGVVFMEDGDDINERYIESLKLIDGGCEFGIADMEEIDMVSVKSELSVRSLSVKGKMKSAATDMLKSGSIVPGRLSSGSDSMFMDAEDELLSLGSFIYRGIPGMSGYISGRLGIEPDSVRMFNVADYDYPLVVICLNGNLEDANGNLEDADDYPGMMRKIEDCMDTVSCHRLPKDYSYTDIDFIWKDTEFYDETHDAYFIICHYRPCKNEVETGRKCIETGVSDGLSLEKNGEDVEIDLPGSVRFRTAAGVRFLKLVCEWLNGKIVTDCCEVWEALIGKLSRELFFRIVNYDNGSSENFIYRHMK